ncbi:E3 ubiquitin-protein ligase MIB2-like isoform X2 [Littorina saxatilis]|uniref:E3 ubiquitin-protein ligase MIB2-like isoform X2 n=1 Tax=Littorina saxatilis TaxID=31220 RepID=UPI0038B57C9A
MSLLGLRVLRGPDWRGGDTDGGEGHVGTVIELLGDHTMRVLWDMGQESTCSAGHDGRCALRVLDTAQIGVRHPDTRCSDCGESDIWGMLWRCRDCTGCDLCPLCYSDDRHDLRHQFVRIDTPESKGQFISKRKTSVKNRSLGLFPGSKVTRGKDWQWGDQDGGQGSEGEVKGYENASPDSVRNLVRVEWPGGDVKTYRHGFYGYVDVTCAEEEEGPYYYRDHLPVLDTDQVQSLSAAVDTEPRNSDSPPTADDREEVPSSGPSGEHASHLTECLSASIESTPKESRISTEGVSSLSISSARSHSDDAETTCAVTEVGTPTSKSESDSEREVQVLKAGDKVRLKEDQQELKAVNCRVGWKEGMEKTAGKVGQVLTVDSEGDLLVSFGRHHFLFAPACCTHVTSDTPVDSLRLDTRPAPGGERKTEASGNTAGDLRLDTRPAMSGERKTETSGNTAGDLRLDTRPAPGGERKTEASGNTAGDLRLDTRPAMSGERKTETSEEPKAMFKKLREAVINEKSRPKVESIPGDSSFLFSADPGLLLPAVQSGDYETVRQLCLADTSLVELEIQRLTPLILACNRGHRQVVRVLLDCGADVNHCIPPHRTTIGAALERSHEDIVELMLEQGADPFSLDNKGHTFLHIAAWHNLPRAITALAARGVDVNALDDVHDTALHLAIVKHHHEAVEALMAIPGVDLTVPNINGYPMMHHAASKGNSRAIELMLEKDRSQVHALLQGATPLHTAVHNDYDDCVRVLVLNGGADVNFKDTVSSDTPLTLACIRGMYRAAEALLELGADIQAQNHNGHTPLHLVIGGHRSKDEYGPEGQQENQVRVALASLLVSNGALVDAPDLAGRDPFSYGLAAIREGVRAFMKQNPRLVRRKGPTEGTIFGAGQLTTGKGRGQLADDLRGVGLPCGVCGASKSDVTLQPCQHKCVCSTCSVKVTRCPLCDEKVTDKLVTGADEQTVNPDEFMQMLREGGRQSS